MSIITFAAKRWLWKDLTIISSNEPVEKFCNYCNINFVKINENNDKSYAGLKEYKNYITNEALKYSNGSFIFGHNSHDYWGLFFIHCLNKNNNKIYYNSQLQEHLKLPFLKSIITKQYRRLLLDVLMLRGLLNVKFDVLSFGEYGFIGIEAKNIIGQYDKNLTPESENIFTSNQKEILCAYGVDAINIILIEEGEAYYKYTDELTDYLVSVNKSHCGFFLKEHPNFKTNNARLLNYIEQLPAEIPAELLLNHNSLVIGIASNTMKTFKNCISLIKLVEIESTKALMYIDFLNSTDILYPTSIEELDLNINTLINSDRKFNS